MLVVNFVPFRAVSRMWLENEERVSAKHPATLGQNNNNKDSDYQKANNQMRMELCQHNKNASRLLARHYWLNGKRHVLKGACIYKSYQSYQSYQQNAPDYIYSLAIVYSNKFMGLLGLLGLGRGAPPSNKLRSCVSYPAPTLSFRLCIAAFCQQNFTPSNPINYL